MFEEVRPGQPLRIRADVWNALMRMAAEYYGGRAGRSAAFPTRHDSRTTVLARNDTGLQLNQFDVVGIDGPLLDSGDWRERTAIKVVVPTANHRGLFGIVVEPIPADKLGLVCVAGVCLARVVIQETGHQFCDVTIGQISHLTSTVAGAGQILWRASGNPGWCLIRFSSAPANRTQWAIVQSGFVNEDATVPKSVPVRRCDWQGGNVQGDPFFVYTPICLGKATALFEGSVVGYQADADGNLIVTTNCFDDPLGTIKAWNKVNPVPQGWEELTLAAGRFLVGAQAGKPWHTPGVTGGQSLESLGEHNHPEHYAVGTIYYQAGTNELARFVSPLPHVVQDLTPPWYAVRWIVRTH
jgi:hypothetical protein